jgi:hypothetical protein
MPLLCSGVLTYRAATAAATPTQIKRWLLSSKARKLDTRRHTSPARKRFTNPVPVCWGSLEEEGHLFYLHFLSGTATPSPTPLRTTSPSRPSLRSTPATPAATTLLLPPPLLLLLLGRLHSPLVCSWCQR